MRPLPLILLLSLPASVLAQAPQVIQPSPAPTQGPKVLPVAPEARGPAPKKPIDPELQEAAEFLYAAMLAKDVEEVARQCKPPFLFEGKSATTDAEIRKKWEGSLLDAQFDGVRLAGVEVLTPEEMAARHGKIPDRLANWPLKGAMISLGNLGGHAAVVLWRKTGQGWQPLAFHD